MTLPEIVEQLRSCNYGCEAGPLENNVAFQVLEEMAGQKPIFSRYSQSLGIPRYSTDQDIYALVRDELLKLLQAVEAYYILVPETPWFERMETRFEQDDSGVRFRLDCYAFEVDS